MRSTIQTDDARGCARNIPKYFIEATDALVNGEIDDREFVRRTSGYVWRLARYHRLQWKKWHLFGLDIDDLAAIGMTEIMTRLGRSDKSTGTWDPNHPSRMSPAVYAYKTGTRAISNAIKRVLKLRGDRTEPIHFVSDPNILKGLDRPVEPQPARLPVQWEDEVADQFTGRATPEEIVAIGAVLRAIEAGGRIPDIVHDADANPERYGGMDGATVGRLIDAVNSRKWERRSVAADARPLVRPVGRDAYTQYMRYEREPERTPEQDAMLALVPARERGTQEIEAAITAETIDALEYEVANRYYAIVSGSLSLARVLHTIKTHRRWAMDGRYTSFGDFIAGALRAEGTVSRTTAYELVRAYDAAIAIAEEYGRDVTALWDEIGASKLQMLADPDEEIRARLTEIAIAGGSRSQMKAARAELVAADDDIDDADVVDEGPARIEPSPPSGSADVEFGADDEVAEVTLHGRVPDGVPIKLIPRDKEGEHDSLRGMPIADAAGRMYFVHRPHPSTEIAFGVEVDERGHLLGGDIMYSTVGRK